jgi:hypothetical protein
MGNIRSLFNVRNACLLAMCAVLGWMAMGGSLWAQKAPATAAKVPLATPRTVPHFVHPNSRPASFKNPPKLPSMAGCYHLTKTNNTWAKDTCLTPEYVKAHYPHPELEPGVQFTQAANAGKTSPIPVTGGAIDVGLQSIGSENDPTFGKGYFSVQLNTNAFNDSSGHSSATQFVDMHKAVSATQSQDLVCIWNVDITAQQYPNTCHPELSGRAVRSGDFVAVQGYQDFQQTGYLKMVFQLSWDSQNGTYGVVAPDTYGLTKTVNGKGNWNELTGSILGYGNGSTANFSKTTLWVAIDAWNCEYDANTDCIAYDPGSWTWAATKPVVALWGLTEEKNNLKPSTTYTNSTPASSLPALKCPGWNGCYIEYTETAQ